MWIMERGALGRLAEARSAFGKHEEATQAAQRAFGMLESLPAAESSNLRWSEIEIRALILFDRKDLARERAAVLVEKNGVRPEFSKVCRSLGLAI